MAIYDGWYLDNHHHDITINSGSIQVKQRFEPGKVLYETISPLISYYREGYGFKTGSIRSLYINKLKLKVFALYNEGSAEFEGLKMELLVSSEYSINVIGRDILEYQETFHDILLALLLMAQLLVQGYGVYHISEGVMSSH